MGDVIDLVDEARIVTTPPVQLPLGVYWFSGIQPSVALAVLQGTPAGASVSLSPGSAVEGSALGNALAWVEESWDAAMAVPPPRFTVGQDIVVEASGHDGIIRTPRRFVSGGWLYTVFDDGQQLRRPEPSL